MMLLLGLLASLQAAPAEPPSTAVRVQNRVTVRIVRGARVEQGRSAEPHSTAQIRVVERDGEQREVRLVEFH